MIPYLSGLLLVAWLPRLAWLPVLLLLLLPLMRRCRWQRGVFLFVAASLYAAFWGSWQLGHRLPEHHVRSDVEMRLQIDSLVQQQGRRQVFTATLVAADDAPAVFSRLRRLRLSYYDSEPLLQAGDRLQAQVRLFPPRGLSNPAAFDRERRYLSEGLDARGYIRTLHAQTPAGWSLASLRQTLHNHIDTTFSPAVAATLNALVLGDRTGLESVQWRLLSETGTAHLLVVSGLHVALVAGLGVVLARCVCLPLLLVGVSALVVRRIGLLLAFGAAAAYALIAGFGLPVQRALIMVAAFLAGEWWLHPLSSWQRWRLALLLVTLAQPLAVVEPGAWLSFTAVALLIWLAGIKRRGVLRAADWWRIQLQLFIGMLPLTALLFNQAGWLAPLVNALALPLVSLFVICLPLLLPLALSETLPALNRITELGIEGFWGALAAAREQLGLYLPLVAPTAAGLLFGGIAALWWLLPLPLRWRWLALILLWPLWVTVPEPPVGRFRAWVMDVGQGLAVLVETENRSLLYDTGPGYSGGGSVFPYAIAPLLRAHNRQRIDYVVISHDDSDHSGGLRALKQQVAIGTLVAGQPERVTDMRSVACSEAGSLDLDSVTVRLLQVPGARSDNERSCVLLLQGRYCTLLLPGDLGFAGERVLAEADLPTVDWLLAGHHGSASATSQAWLERLQPQQVIFSRGRFNRFGHPAAEVLQRVEAINAQSRDTALEGALLLEDRPGCPATGEREAKRRYWTAG